MNTNSARARSRISLGTGSVSCEPERVTAITERLKSFAANHIQPFEVSHKETRQNYIIFSVKTLAWDNDFSAKISAEFPGVRYLSDKFELQIPIENRSGRNSSLTPDNSYRHLSRNPFSNTVTFFQIIAVVILVVKVVL